MSHSDSEINRKNDSLTKRKNIEIKRRQPNSLHVKFKPLFKHKYLTKSGDRRYASAIRSKIKELRNNGLLWAVSYNNVNDLTRLLEMGANPNHADELGRSPLHIAASKGYSEIVEILLENGADPNSNDKLSNTPLHLAACTNNFAVISLLLRAGADAKLMDIYGKNPLQLAESKLQILQKNFRQGSMELVLVLHELKLIITLITAYAEQQDNVALKELDSELNKLNLSSETAEEVDQQMSKVLNELQELRINM